MHGGDSLYSRMSGAHIYPDRMVDVELDHKSQKVADRLSENINIIANEPSLAFFRIQEHVRKTLPQLVEQKHEVEDIQQQVQGACFDAEYDSKAVQTLQKSSIHFQNIQELLKNAMFMKQQIEYEDQRRRQSRLNGSGASQPNGMSGYTSEDSGSNIADSALSTDSSLAAVAHTAEAFDGGEDFMTDRRVPSWAVPGEFAINSEYLATNKPTIDIQHTTYREHQTHTETVLQVKQTTYTEQRGKAELAVHSEETVQSEQAAQRETSQKDEYDPNAREIVQPDNLLSQTRVENVEQHVQADGKAQRVTEGDKGKAEQNYKVQTGASIEDWQEGKDEVKLETVQALSAGQGTTNDDAVVVKEIPKTIETTQEKERNEAERVIFSEQTRHHAEVNKTEQSEIMTEAHQTPSGEHTVHTKIVSNVKAPVLLNMTAYEETTQTHQIFEETGGAQPVAEIADNVVEDPTGFTGISQIGERALGVQHSVGSDTLKQRPEDNKSEYI